MSYKMSKGERKFGDLDFEDDNNTKIDFDEDYIALVTAGNSVLAVSGSAVGIGTSTPNSGLHVNSSFAMAIAAKSSDYTLTGDDHTILVDCSGGNVTLTLPTAVGCAGRMYMIKRIDGAANTANIDPNGSEEIEGSTNSASVAARGSIVIQSDNSGWWKMSEYINPP